MKYQVIKVLVEEEYLVPMQNEEKSEINGWTIDQIKQNWFINKDLNSYHATRDSSRVGNGRRLVAIDGEKVMSDNTTAVVVVKVAKAETHPDENLQHLSVLTVAGKTAIAGKLEDGSHRYPEGSLAVFLPVGTIIPLDLLEKQGFYWDAEKGRGMLGGNKRNRVKAVTRGSVTSEGILFPVERDVNINDQYYVEGVGDKWTDVTEGDILNDFYGIEVTA